MSNGDAGSGEALGSTVADGDAPAVRGGEPGSLLAGRYRIERLLGEGSQGRVYAARDERRGVPVAIKIPRSDRVLKRVEREVVAMNTLRHTNIVSLIEFLVEHDPPLVVMERLSSTLARGIKEAEDHRVSPRELATLGLGALAALEYMHGFGWVHRDVKPGNIAWVSEGERGTAKLLDLGLSKAWCGTDAAPRRFVGTGRYASLRVLRGGLPSPIDDLWGLFHSLVHGATGGLPWEGLDVREEIAASHEVNAGAWAGVHPVFGRMHGVLAGAAGEVPYGAMRECLRGLSGVDGGAVRPKGRRVGAEEARGPGAAFEAAAAWRTQRRG